MPLLPAFQLLTKPCTAKGSGGHLKREPHCLALFELQCSAPTCAARPWSLRHLPLAGRLMHATKRVPVLSNGTRPASTDLVICAVHRGAAELHLLHCDPAVSHGRGVSMAHHAEPAGPNSAGHPSREIQAALANGTICS